MTPIQFAEKYHFNVINQGDGNKREFTGIYCCDLLSIVMGRAKENDAWITVMGNMNSVAVAVLSDVACIILSEGMPMDNDGLFKAQAQNVCILSSELPTYEITKLLTEALG